MVGATHIDGHVKLHRRGHVVYGGQMEEVLDRAFEFCDPLLFEAQQRHAQIAEHGMDAPAHGRLGDRFPVLDQLVQTPLRILAHKHMDLALALQQALDQPAADEAGRSRHEVGHVLSSKSIPRG